MKKRSPRHRGARRALKRATTFFHQQAMFSRHLLAKNTAQKNIVVAQCVYDTIAHIPTLFRFAVDNAAQSKPSERAGRRARELPRWTGDHRNASPAASESLYRERGRLFYVCFAPSTVGRQAHGHSNSPVVLGTALLESRRADGLEVEQAEKRRRCSVARHGLRGGHLLNATRRLSFLHPIPIPRTRTIR